MSSKSKEKLLVFDVDGTLTPARQRISEDMLSFMMEINKSTCIALVGGSDLSKISEQMSGEETLQNFDFVFSENGLVAHKSGRLIAKQSIREFLGEEKLQKVINFSLRYMSELELPAKRGTFVEFRTGLINLCPVGRSCSQAERDEFFAYDKEHKIREKFVDALTTEFGDLGLKFSIGGQISIDAFPIGWDKRYCLKFLENEGYQEIHFFGDRTEPGGNDYEIYDDPRTIGHTVKNPDDTKEQVSKLLGLGS